MASKHVTKRLCELCEKNDKQIKARTLCYECHILLCEPCSNYHKRLSVTNDHNLIELVKSSQSDPSLSKQTSTSFNEDELASDFLDPVTLTEDTVPYREAQVAVGSTSVKIKCLEFSVKRPEDKEKVDVTGVLCLSDNVVVVDVENKMLKLFDQSGTYLSSTELKDSTCGITCVHDSTFATCGISGTVYLWTVRGQTIASKEVSYHMDHEAHGIHYNGTYYCVLHCIDNAITILDRQGRQVRRIIMKEACGKKFIFRWDIHMDSDKNIYVPCMFEHGVLCMTIEGNALWFTPLPIVAWGITEIQGTLCVDDYRHRCIHLISKGGNYIRKLLNEDNLEGRPFDICYGQDEKLYVSYGSLDDKHHIITVFSV